jgi:ectoine hydroxylase-related dioxygenase (phytanoyl-CoA dioxygenase family)
VEQHPALDRLRTDPRITGIAASLLGPDFEYAYSDGNLFYCDVYWHFDAFGSPIEQRHIKMYFYLDALRRDTGALRVIPGSSDIDGSFVAAVRPLFMDPDKARETLGIALEDVPSWTLEVDPGDVIVGNYRTMHATFGGGPRRRLFTVNFKEPLGTA